ncbi:MAG: PAS domain S-box protein [Candidatus Margulisiibacteriota bacterium]
MEESLTMENNNFGTEKFINKNCWLVTALGRQIYSRCRYCRLTWRQCFYGPKFLLPSLLIPLLFFLIVLMAGIKIERNLWGLLVIAYLSIFGIYSYLFNKSADEVVKASFKVAESETEIGKLKAALEKNMEEINAGLYRKNKELESTLTEVNRVEEALRESEEKYRSLCENSPIGIVLIDENGIIKYENPAMAEIMGVPEGEVSKAIGRCILEMPNVKAAGVTNSIKEVLRGKPIKNATFSFTSLYGKSSFLLVNGVPLKKEGKVFGGMLMVEDITERKRAEEELKKRAEELEKMNKFMLGRELDMIELKKEVNRLLSELGRPQKYGV